MLGRLNLKKITKKKKLIGRGGKSGKSSGRGRGGQLSRSGGRGEIGVFFEGGQMPLARRLPIRGFVSRNKKTYELIRLDALQKFVEDGVVVDGIMLKAQGLLKSSKSLIKVLANGGNAFDKKITLKINAISSTAREIVERCGGEIVFV